MLIKCFGNKLEPYLVCAYVRGLPGLPPSSGDSEKVNVDLIFLSLNFFFFFLWQVEES